MNLRNGLTGAGLPEPIVNTVLNIQSNFVRGDFDIVTGDVERLSGQPPRPLEEVLASYFAEAAS